MSADTAHARDAMLAAADWLEANPDRHIRGVYARDGDGNEAEPTSVHATCFCAWGRVMREFYGVGGEDNPYFDSLHKIVAHYDPNYGEILSTNDSLSQPQAIAELRRRVSFLPVD